MKKFIFSLLLLVTALQAGAQKPVTVSHELTAKGSEVVIEFIAEIADGYYMYSTDIPKGGPKPTYVKFTELVGAELVGELAPVDEAKSKYEPVFDMQVTYFEEFASFTQKFKVLNENFKLKEENRRMKAELRQAKDVANRLDGMFKRISKVMEKAEALSEGNLEENKTEEEFVA